MTHGYDKPLYVLPFDHRGSFENGMFGWKGALTREAAVAEMARRYREFVDDFERAHVGAA
jgi:hypothetical protein